MQPNLLLATLVLLGLPSCGQPPGETGESEAAPAVESAPRTAETTDVSPRSSDTSTPDAAQDAGTIQGTLDGEARTWISLYRERDGDADATSTYQTRTIGRMDSRSLSLGGHVGPTMSPDGSIRISVTATTPLEDCPCTFETGTVEYVVDVPDDRWEAHQATVTVDAFSENGDGTLAAAGRFQGTLRRPDGASDDAMAVEGEFDIRQILRVGN